MLILLFTVGINHPDELQKNTTLLNYTHEIPELETPMIKSQLSLILATINKFKQNTKTKVLDNNELELLPIKKYKLTDSTATKTPQLPPLSILKNNIQEFSRINITHNLINYKQQRNSYIHRNNKNINIKSYVRSLQGNVNNIASLYIKPDDIDATHYVDIISFQNTPKIALNKKPFKLLATTKKQSKESKSLNSIDYWQTLHSIESKQGKLLYRPRNKARNCSYTSGPCGHHQLTVQALKDIGCHSLQCREDRLIYTKSLKLSKELLALNEKRLKKDGISKLEDYEKYLIHQQGANGIKNIIEATQGNKKLSKRIRKNMANNSPYSYKQYKLMGSKLAAKRFMHYWKHKWIKEKHLIIATATKAKNDLTSTSASDASSFSDDDLHRFALNLNF